MEGVMGVQEVFAPSARPAAKAVDGAESDSCFSVPPTESRCLFRGAPAVGTGIWGISPQEKIQGMALPSRDGPCR